MGRRNLPAGTAVFRTTTAGARPGLKALGPVWGILAAGVLIAFAPVLNNGFVDWDDPAWVVNNLAFRGPGWEPFRYAFTTFTGGVYQPLGWLVQSFTYALFGLDPRGYHRVSLVFHALNVLLLHLLCVRLVARGMPGAAERLGGKLAWLCAIPVALYAVHPLRVEPVAWATAQAYLPSVTFALFATLAYLRAHPEPGIVRRSWLAAAYVLVVLAVLTKGSAVVLPVVFLILDAYPLGRLRPARSSWRPPLVEKLPILVVCLAFTAVAVAAKHSATGIEETAQPVLAGRIAQAAFGACFYLAKSVWPFGITAFYPRPERGDFGTPLFAACVAAVMLALAAALWQRTRRPWLATALAAYLVIAAPYLGLVRVGVTLAADRYSYAPVMAWVVVACAGLAALAERRWPRPALVPAGLGTLAVVCGLMVLCAAQCRVWTSSARLWGQAVAHAPWSAELHALCGSSLADEGKLDEAAAELREALRLRPDQFEANHDLGSVLDRLGQTNAAAAHLSEAVRLRPADPRARLSLGRVLLRQGHVDRAIDELNKAVEQNPASTEAHTTLADALALRGRLNEATAHYVQALRSDPNYSPARINLALTMARQGHPAAAADELREAIGRDPANADARFAHGAILLNLHRLDEATTEFATVLRLRPDHARARAFLEMSRAVSQQAARETPGRRRF